MADENNTGDKFIYLLIGAGLGAVAALLFAPKAGSELRADLADAARRGADQARDQARQIGERATEYYQTSADYANDMVSRGKDVITDATERGKEIINRQKSSVTAAIEAGKQGYREAKLNDIAKSGASSGAAYDEN